MGYGSFYTPHGFSSRCLTVLEVLRLAKTLAETVAEKLISSLGAQVQVSNSQLNDALRLLSKWRSELIRNTMVQREGTKVLDGPLKGLDFLEQSTEGCHVAKLLGVYEQPLHPYFGSILSGEYEAVINLGSAEGYYAVGFAKAVPEIISIAYDTNPQAQAACRNLAIKNGVQQRVSVNGEFTLADLESYSKASTLLFCDIEGGEEELLDVDRAPALAVLDLIVESHECFRPGVTGRLVNRFSSTHDIKLVQDSGMRTFRNVPPWFAELSHLDQLLAAWEWRAGPTPWLVMRSKSRL